MLLFVQPTVINRTAITGVNNLISDPLIYQIVFYVAFASVTIIRAAQTVIKIPTLVELSSLLYFSYTGFMFKNLFFPFLLAALLTSCVSTGPKESKEYSKVFNTNFDTLWRATQQALLNYPMNVNNMEAGFLQTLFITGKNQYIAPHLKGQKIYPSGYEYRLNINIIKGKKRSKISILKEAHLKKDFFSEPIDLDSDGFEEKLLIYRISREIKIENLLKKAHEKTNR